VNIVVGITGASGAAYGIACVRIALVLGHTVLVCATETGIGIIENEVDGMEGVSPATFRKKMETRFPGEKLTVFVEKDFSAPFASGSNSPDGMVIAPCSVGTMGRIASGVSSNLIERGADVCLKERKKLVLLVRETPLNLVHLRNMETLVLSGAIVMPAAPGFYSHPKRIEELWDSIAERALSLLGVPGVPSRKWGEKEVFHEKDTRSG